MAASSSPWRPIKPPPPPPKPPPPADPPPLSSDDSEDSGNEHGTHSVAISSDTLADGIFKPYLQIYSNSNSTTSERNSLAKIRSFLSASQSRALSCLICLSRIKHTDPVWSCSAECYALFHLHCIQSWAQQALSIANVRSVVPASSWHCPKCRQDYHKTLIPRNYYCFCGKLRDPPADPWIVPHSCGEICGRDLPRNCGHECVLLCHPGPCPPCPKTVRIQCYCSANAEMRRCGMSGFSCGQSCRKVLGCGVHRCEDKCHEGNCPPCRRIGVFRCLCGKTESERECGEREFRCVEACEGLLECGKHFCEKGCHAGECGDCPLRGKRMCPCGKVEYKGISCDAPAPVCGATCERMLGCGIHRCPERCHQGPCLETCRIVRMKSCRCRSLKKEVPCHQHLVCEKRCPQARNCGRHACKRRCCDGDCPPCPEVCGRKLRCNNHKCPSPCHSGPCAPCPLMVTISCFCGETHFEVPCGVEKDQKPPKCRNLCSLSRLCRHGSVSKPHRCHYRACPPCRLICEEKLPCDHICKQRCHGPQQPPNPEFTLRPKKKKAFQVLPTNILQGSLCPPCKEIILKPCLGKHFGAEMMMICSEQKPFMCGNNCGSLLQCGNHYCEKPCHAVLDIPSMLVFDAHGNQIQITMSQGNYAKKYREPCEECTLPCMKERSQGCSHACSLPCHTGECPPCKALVKRSCHCGTLVHAFECYQFNSLSENEKMKARSCGGPCHRKLTSCTHLCSMTCHPGDCQSSDSCSKKVTARCACQLVRKELLCKDVQVVYRAANRDSKLIPKSQFGIGVLPCNSECRKASEKKVEPPELHLRKVTETENEIDLVGVGNVQRRKRRHRRIEEIQSTSKLKVLVSGMKKAVVLVVAISLVAASIYFGIRGLFWLSDWMNELEEHHPRKQSRF